MNESDLPASLMARRPMNARDAAQALDVHEKTLRNYAGKLGCPHSKGPSGEYLFDLEMVRQWMDDTGVTGECGRPGITRPDPSEVQSSRPMLSVNDTAFVSGTHNAKTFVRAYLSLPMPIILPFEREVLEGRRQLSPDEVKALVLAAVMLKASRFEDAYHNCGGLVNRNASEVAKELNEQAHIDAELYAERLAAVLGKAATAAESFPYPPPWEGDKPELIDPSDYNNPPADPTLADYLAAFDAKQSGALPAPRSKRKK